MFVALSVLSGRARRAEFVLACQRLYVTGTYSDVGICAAGSVTYRILAFALARWVNLLVL